MNDKASFFIPNSFSDNDLHHWNAFRKGSKSAFTAVYHRHVDALYHYGERLTADKALIEDCIQDLFAELWTRQAELPAVQTVKFYLFKALKRKIARKQTQQARLLSQVSTHYDFELTLPASVEQDEILFSEAQKAVLLRAVN